MTKRRRYPSDDHVGIGVMARMREMMLAEVQLDRLASAVRVTKRIIADGRAAKSDMSAAEAALAAKQAEIRSLEGVLAAAEIAAGIDPRPRRFEFEDHHP